MQPQLPESERVALQCLAGARSHVGNWKPSVAYSVALACHRRGIDEAGYLELIGQSRLGEQLRQNPEFRNKPGKLEPFLLKRFSEAAEGFRDSFGVEDVQQKAEALWVRVLWSDCWGTDKAGTTARAAALAVVALAAERGAFTFTLATRIYLSFIL